MREIIFRGKRTDNGEWIYGVPTIDSRGEKVIVENVFECEEYNCRGACCLYVDEITVGQYTGLTDKNGKKIFEGDILKYINEDGEPHYISVVFENCAFLIDDEGIIDADLLTSYVCLGIEVVGNIFDDPELIEGKIES